MICHFVIVLLWFAFGPMCQNTSAHPVNLPNLKNNRQMSGETSEEVEPRKPHLKQSSADFVVTTKRVENDFEEISLIHVPERPKQLYNRRYPLSARQNVANQYAKRKPFLEENERTLREKLLSLDFVTREETDHSLFGRFIGASLKNITDRELSIELQHEILHAIMRTQIRLLKQEMDLKNMSVLHAVDTTPTTSTQSKRQSYNVDYESNVKDLKGEEIYKTSTDSYNDNHNFALYSK